MHPGRTVHLDKLLGSLGSDVSNRNETITWKYNFISFVLLRDYFNSLNFYRNSELSRNQIGKSGVQVKKENEIHRRVLTFSKNPRIWSFYVAVLQRTAKKCTKM